MIKLVAMVGSIRKDSHNLKIIHHLQKQYQDRLDIEVLNIGELPYYNQDIENDPPEVVKQFKASVKNADGVLIATPEYNHSIPGVLKNALDWLSRVDKVMVGKPTLIVGASTGVLGTIRAQIHLRQILNSGIAARMLQGNEVLIGSVHEKLNEQGQLIHEPTVAFLDTVVENFIQLVK